VGFLGNKLDDGSVVLTVAVSGARAEPLQRARALPNFDPYTIETFEAVATDESWRHLLWIEKEIYRIAKRESHEEQDDKSLEIHRKIDRDVYATIAAGEAELMRA
jgi:hypothetical protein